MAPPSAGQGSVSLDDRAPLISGKLEGEGLGALLRPGATRSFVDPIIAKLITSPQEVVDLSLEFVCAGGLAVTANRVIRSLLPKVDQ